jgi:hypothetical protein
MEAALMNAPLSPEVAHLLEGKTTVAAKIRALAGAGYPRADIARMLGKRYQHVRNVLEEPREAKAAAGFTSGGVAEGDVGAFVHDKPKTYRLEVRNGSVTVPPEVLVALGAGPNGVIIAELDGEFFKIISISESVRRIQERLRPYWRPGVSVVDELIADRRREAAEEDREYDEWQARNRQND